jgi:excisionase family DNA binding protein
MTTLFSRRLIKVKQAAEYIGVNAWKIRKLVQEGLLPYIPGDGATAPWLIDLRDLDAYIDAQKVSFR